jgi:hypothetical protein
MTLGRESEANPTRCAKGTTPARGEEARVVVYQPRGVGLIHTRPRPGDFNYTHESAGGNLLSALENVPSGKFCRLRKSVFNCHF